MTFDIFTSDAFVADVFDEEDVVYYCVFEAHVLQDLLVMWFWMLQLTVLLHSLRINYRYYLVVILRLHKRTQPISRYRQRSYLIPLPIHVLPSLIKNRSKTLSNKRQQPPITQLLEENVILKSIRIYCHRHSDTQLRR